MIELKKIEIRNFLSVGAINQTVDLTGNNLTLILGENLDLGGDGARNGVGKTSLIQAISYGLFGVPINNIKRDNLINRTNGKAMQVTIDFSVNGTDYQIVRGRKPNTLKFYINNQEQEAVDDSQGDSRETQEAIERILAMTPEMFKQIVALNTYNEPFLGMKVGDQRVIIEQLLGITLLSEKAEAIKELNKGVKADIQREEFRVKGVESANQKINEQIDSLKKRQRLWTLKREEDLSKLASEYDDLSVIDIDAELAAHVALAEYLEKQKQLEAYNGLLARQKTWNQKQERDITDLQDAFNSLSSIDIVAELQAHKDLVTYTELLRAKTDQNTKITRLKLDFSRETKFWSKLNEEVKSLNEHKCYACGSELHDENHATVLEEKVTALAEITGTLENIKNELAELESNTIVVGDEPITFYKTESEAVRHSSELEAIAGAIDAKKAEVDPYAEQLSEMEIPVPGTKPTTHYASEADAIKHSGKVSTLLDQIQRKHDEVDPYGDQIAEMESDAIQEVNYDEINRLTKLLQHQEYLLDLLTNKKSFVRKRIISQNLGFLNTRLSTYLEKIGLPHQVVFQDDLSVVITDMGRELDFCNLSRGEMNRVVLALSLSFRDVFEHLYNPINSLFVDELIDSGMDSIGIENGLALLKEITRSRSKAVWLVSHRDELAGRVDRVLKVIKEGGFTNYSFSEE